MHNDVLPTTSDIGARSRAKCDSNPPITVAVRHMAISMLPVTRAALDVRVSNNGRQIPSSFLTSKLMQRLQTRVDPGDIVRPQRSG